MKIRKTFTILLVLFLAACSLQSAPAPTPTPFTGTPRPVIIDTDMAADDWMAILYLLKRPEVSIEAITVTGTGEAHCEPGIKNAMRLTALVGQPDIPVACGRGTPLQGNHTFPAAWRERVDALAGLTLPDNPAAPAPQSAVELLTTTIETSPDKTTILALGPLTNLAKIVEADSGLKDNIEMIYIMGGAVDVPGNVGYSHASIDNPFAEWNIYVDPHAAALVFGSGVPITLVPLDASNHAPVTENFVKRIRNNHRTPEARFVFDVMTKTEYRDFIQMGGYYFWDTLAAAILTDNSLATFETKTLIVVEEEGIDSGRTQVSEGGASIRVAVNADGERFEQLFLDALNAPE